MNDTSDCQYRNGTQVISIVDGPIDEAEFRKLGLKLNSDGNFGGAIQLVLLEVF